MTAEQCERCGKTLEHIWDYPQVTINDVTIHEVTRESLIDLFGGPGEDSFLKSEGKIADIVKAADTDEIQIFVKELLLSKGETRKFEDILPKGLEKHEYDDYSYVVPESAPGFFISFASQEGKTVISLIEQTMGPGDEPISFDWFTLAEIDFKGVLNPLDVPAIAKGWMPQ